MQHTSAIWRIDLAENIFESGTSVLVALFGGKYSIEEFICDCCEESPRRDCVPNWLLLSPSWLSIVFTWTYSEMLCRKSWQLSRSLVAIGPFANWIRKRLTLSCNDDNRGWTRDVLCREGLHNIGIKDWVKEASVLWDFFIRDALVV